MRRGSAALVSRVLGGIVGEQERSVVDRSEPSLVNPKIFEPFGSPTSSSMVIAPHHSGQHASSAVLAAKRVTPDQIAEAQRMAREWLAKHQQ